jgi:hypothetical protein
MVNAWGGRLKMQLAEHYAGRLEVVWTDAEEASGQRPPGILQWLTLRQEARLMGRIRLAWHPGRPDSLQIRTEMKALPEAPIPLEPVLKTLTGVAVVAALGGWVWFVIQDWHRVWNRVSSFSGGYDAEHASKLEVYLVLLGWVIALGVAAVVMGILRLGFDGFGRLRQRVRVWAFARRELDQVLERLLGDRLEACRGNIQDCLNLGQAHPGNPLPTHAHLVWGQDGRYLPAEGYRWSSEDPASLDVAPKD